MIIFDPKGELWGLPRDQPAGSRVEGDQKDHRRTPQVRPPVRRVARLPAGARLRNLNYGGQACGAAWLLETVSFLVISGFEEGLRRNGSSHMSQDPAQRGGGLARRPFGSL